MSATPPALMICTHPRSGSTYFCQLLESTGKLGRPQDYFNAGYPSGVADPGNPAHLPAHYRHYLASAATDNGVISTKMFWFDLARLAQAGLARNFRGYRVVMLERADKLGQAISSSRALRSGKMWAAMPGSDKPVEYDYSHIRARLVGVLRAEAQWRQILARNRDQPLHLLYEDVVRDPQAAVDRTARHIGITEPVPIDPAGITVSVQRDARSSEWRERFLAEARKSDPELLSHISPAPAG